jgi:lipopolysaccharide/colanic/teichoic acid biosynthesis glycosyltransferase
VNRFAKRSFDVVVATVGVVLLSPVMLAIAMAIRIDSGAPVFFRQERVGRAGRRFKIWKFRTMVVGAHRMSANVSALGDPRVTRVGAWLRRTYLDELPQLFNVIVGDMSMVGPRPETPEFVEYYTAQERDLLSIRPGIAGPSTLGFMDEAEILASVGNAEAYYVDRILHDRAALDLTYVHRHTLPGDVSLLVRQLGEIVLGRD